MKKVGIVSVIALLGMLLAACGGGGPEPVTIDVNMAEFSFTPSEITFPAGAEVTINLTNSGTIEHEILFVQLDGDNKTDLFDNDPSKVTASGGEGFHVGSDEEIAEEGYHVELEPGASGSLVFTVPAEKAGTWELACFIDEGAHYDQGMHGTVVVTAP